MTTATETVSVSGEAREIALAETRLVLSLTRDEARADELAGVVEQLEDSRLEEPQARALEGIVELALQAGRIRAVYGPGGEQALLRLYRRLPSGSELVASAEQVSDALAALSGKRLDDASVRAVGPAAFVLTVQAEGVELSVRLDRQGARLASVGV